MLEKLNSKIFIYTRGSLVTKEGHLRFEQRYGKVVDYQELVSESGDIELEINKEFYIRFWHPDRCIEMDEAYLISEYISEAIPIGDDGGGRVLMYMKGVQGWGLYFSDFGDLDREDAVYVCADLRAFLIEGKGWGVLNC